MNTDEINMSMSKRIEIVERVFDNRLTRIQKLTDEGFYDEAVILIVTVSEVLLKDLFKIYKEGWFNYPSENKGRIDYRSEIRKYLESIRAYDDFIKNYYVYQPQTSGPEIECIYQTLFGSGGRDRIKFQNLTETYGAKNAYKTFLDIRLMNILAADESESHRKWELLVNLFKDRHEIIHKGGSTTVGSDKIAEVLSSLMFLKRKLLNSFRKYHQNSILDEV